MSVKGNPFRWVPGLQYIASVKMVEISLRNPKYNELMRNMARANSLDDGKIQELEIGLNRLPIPEALKINLKSLLAPMIETAIDWLARVATTTTWELRNHYWNHLVNDLMVHLQWYNIGCVDGRKTLESYVSTRETIHVVIWNQLCYYCIEDEIIKFSRTIDWDSCENCLPSIFQIYWYHKIYGILPPKRILHSDIESYQRCYRINDKNLIAMLDEERMLRIMFVAHRPLTTYRGQNIAAIKYFRNHLQHERELDEFIGDSNFEAVSEELIIYVLKELKKNTLINFISKSFVLCRLIQAPWILFIDHWISVFDNVESTCLIEFFQKIGDDKRQITNDRNRILYEPFEKVWRIYYRKFNSDGGKIGQAFCKIFARNDLTLLELMFEDLVDNQRKLLLEQVKDYSRNEKVTEIDLEFSAQFSELILKDDEERKLFSEFLRK